jgi:hypothetical protein
MTKTERLTKTEIQKQIDTAWREALENAGMKWSRAAAEDLAAETNISIETRLARGITLGMALGLGGIGKEAGRKIKTQQQLDESLQKIRHAGEAMPTMIRRATKELVRTLPRRGGPGRQPKLNAKESAQVCDQIGMFMRRGDNLRGALKRVADLAATLLGKKVSPRTLQKAWDKRDQHSAV